MKRGTFILTALIVCAVVAGTALGISLLNRKPVNEAFASAPSEADIPLPVENSVSDVALDVALNKLAIADGHSVKLVDAYGNAVATLSHGEPQYTCVAHTGDGTLWAYNSSARNFDVYTSDNEYSHTQDINVSNLESVELFKVYKNQYVIMSGETSQHTGAVWLTNLDAGTHTKLQPDGIVLSFAFTQDGLLAVIINNSSSISIQWYDPQDMSELRDIKLTTFYAASLGFAPSGKLYYATNRSVYSLDTDSKEASAVCYLPSDAGFVHNEASLRIFPSDNGVYVWRWDEPNVEYYQYISESDASALVMNAPFYIPSAMEIYESTGKAIDYRDRDVASSEQFLTMMMAQDVSTDVYMLQSYTVPATRSIINKGYFVDLFESAKIKADSDTWFPRILSDSTSDGRLFGYPASVVFDAMFVKRTKLDELGIELPDNALAWDALLDLLEPYAGMKPFPLIINPTHLKELLLWRANEADERHIEMALREALDILDRCKALGMLELDSLEYAQTYENSEDYAFDIDLNTLGKQGVEEEYMAVPSLKSVQNGTPVSYDWLIINPFSKRIDDALLLIEAYVDAKQKGDMQWTAVLSDDAEQYPMLAGEWMEQYRQIMSNARAEFAYELEYDFIRIAEQYLSRQISQENAIDQMLQKLRIQSAE